MKKPSRIPRYLRKSVFTSTRNQERRSVKVTNIKTLINELNTGWPTSLLFFEELARTINSPIIAIRSMDASIKDLEYIRR